MGRRRQDSAMRRVATYAIAQQTEAASKGECHLIRKPMRVSPTSRLRVQLLRS